jgi:hypothetical protein
MRLGVTSESGNFELDQVSIGSMQEWVKGYQSTLFDIMDDQT